MYDQHNYKDMPHSTYYSLGKRCNAFCKDADGAGWKWPEISRSAGHRQRKAFGNCYRQCIVSKWPAIRDASRLKDFITLPLAAKLELEEAKEKQSRHIWYIYYYMSGLEFWATSLCLVVIHWVAVSSGTIYTCLTVSVSNLPLWAAHSNAWP